jgi:hypothetical protein
MNDEPGHGFQQLRDPQQGSDREIGAADRTLARRAGLADQRLAAREYDDLLEHIIARHCYGAGKQRRHTKNPARE